MRTRVSFTFFLSGTCHTSPGPQTDSPQSGILAGPKCTGSARLFLRGFFIFLFFIFVFYKNIFSIWKFTGIYPGRSAAGRPGPGRPAEGRQGHFWKKNCRENYAQVPRGRPWPPGCRATGSPGRPAAGRPALPPLYKGWLVPPPLICITKIPETKKKEGGREGVMSMNT